jgi:hypothetical protein
MGATLIIFQHGRPMDFLDGSEGPASTSVDNIQPGLRLVANVQGVALFYPFPPHTMESYAWLLKPKKKSSKK